MRIRKSAVILALFAAGATLSGCYYGRPGYNGDHHGRHHGGHGHHGDHDHDDDHDHHHRG